MRLYYDFDIFILINIAILVLVAALQSMNLISVYAMELSQNGKRLRMTVEGMVLLYIVINFILLLFLQWCKNAGMKFEEVPKLIWIRYTFATLFLILMIYLYIVTKRWQTFLLILVDFTLLPVCETLLNDYFFILPTIGNIYLGLRAYRLESFYNRRRQSNLSGFAIKESMDSLPSGIFVTDEDKQIIFMNNQMQELLYDLMGKLPNDADKIYWHLMRRAVRNKNDEMKIDGKVIHNKKNDTYWIFNRKMPQIGNNYYAIIVASDITKEWNMNLELQKQTKELRKQSDELKLAIEDLEEECHRQQIVELKGMFHDILGHKIALLLRYLREKKVPEKDLLSEFESGLPEIKDLLNTKDDLGQHIEVLIKTFEGIGVKLEIKGDLPQNKHLLEVCISIIREAATNAVRHGYAKNIYVTFEDNAAESSMRITNDGETPPHTMTEGNGIKGMRKRMVYEGGYLIVDRIPEFAIIAVIPKIQ